MVLKNIILMPLYPQYSAATSAPQLKNGKTFVKKIITILKQAQSVVIQQTSELYINAHTKEHNKKNVKTLKILN